MEPRQNQAVRERGRYAAYDHEGLHPSDRLAEYAQQETHQRKRRLPQGDLVGQTARRNGRGEGRRTGQQGPCRRRDPRPRHHAGGAQRQQQTGIARQERRPPARGLRADGQRTGDAGRKDDLRAHHLARRLRADHRSHADLRLRGRTPELFGHASLWREASRP